MLAEQDESVRAELVKTVEVTERVGLQGSRDR